jgi:hypothetical protein
MIDLAVVKKTALTFLLLAGVVALPLAFDAASAPSLVPPAATVCDATVMENPDVDQAPMCLLIPECFRNSDCDVLCGPKLGRCVHNDCPARVCTCR